MLLALGALSSTLEALFSSKSPSPQSADPSQTGASPFTLSDGASSNGFDSSSPRFSRISPDTLCALIATQGQAGSAAAANPGGALQDLFSQIDADGDGKISKSEFDNALGAGGTNLALADDVFNKLDKNGDGSVSLKELSRVLKGAGHHHHHAAGAGGSSGQGGSDGNSLLQALNGASTTSTTNGDGSTTTQITYADGSKVTLTTPPNSSSSSSATSSYNFIEQLIQREAKVLSSSASPISVTA
jgi:EF-hand domain pair